MSKKSIVTSLVIAGLVLSFAASTGLAAAQGEKVFIPKEVKDPMTAGLQARASDRQDIPFEIFYETYLPAQQAAYIFMFLKVKNGDIGYAPAPPAQVADPAITGSTNLQSKVNLFVQFYPVQNGVPGKLLKEVYVPAVLEADPSGYDPEASDWYTFGYPLPPGTYLASMALTSGDLKKMAIQYHEFTLPNPASFTKALDTTPIFFLEALQQVEAPEMKPELHKRLFAYSILRMTPSIDREFKVGDALDTFFFIYGVQPKDGQKYDIQIEFEVTQDGEPAIKFAPGEFDAPLISLPLQLTQTLQIKQGDEEVRTEQRDLPPGAYVLHARITDNVSGLKCEKTIDFTVK